MYFAQYNNFTLFPKYCHLHHKNPAVNIHLPNLNTRSGETFSESALWTLRTQPSPLPLYLSHSGPCQRPHRHRNTPSQTTQRQSWGLAHKAPWSCQSCAPCGCLYTRESLWQCKSHRKNCHDYWTTCNCIQWDIGVTPYRNVLAQWVPNG